MMRPWKVLAAVSLFATACGSDMSVDPGSDEPGALSGEVASYVADYEGRSEILHMLRDKAGNERQLLFDAPPELEPGARLKVWASEEGDKLRVRRFRKEISETELRPQPLINGPAKPLRRWAFVLVDLGGGVLNSAGQPITKEAMAKTLFDTATPNSIRSYFREVSYGTQDLDGEVFGPFKYTPMGACDYQGVARAIQPMIPANFGQVLYYFGSRQQCQWAGLAALGTADRPAKNSWYNRSSGCVVLVQEPGHNFGMVHSSSMACKRGATPVSMILPDEAGATCAHSEYGNRFDPMGSGCFHMNGPQKAYQNWLSGCNVVKVTESGTFTLLPLEQACNGVQMLQVPLPAPRAMRFTNAAGAATLSTTFANYFIEFRTPAGFDASLMTPRVLVTVGPDLREAGRSGSRNWLVDMAPATATVGDAALPVGMRYEDPAPNGPKFTVVSMDRAKAVIKIEMPGSANADAPGKGTCDDMTAFTAPGPETCSAAPVNVPTTTPGNDGGATGPRPDAGAAADTGAAPPADAASTPGTGGGPGIDNPGVPPGTGGRSGAGGAGGSRPGADASSPSGSAPPAEPAKQPVAGGCSCRVDGPTGSGQGALPLLAVGALGLVLRRRRRRG